MRPDVPSDWVRGTRRLRFVSSWVPKAVFGDGIGILLFLGAVLYFWIFWRIGFFMTDNWTIANTLLAVADGQLFVEKAVYGPPATETPGYRVVGDRIYGRNYGQLFLALPVLFLIDSLARLVDISIATAGAWSLLLLAFSLRLGSAFDQSSRFAILGSVAALLAFGLNTAFALPLDPRWRAMMALQMTNMAAAAMIGVICYRLLSAIYDRQTGIFIGAATVLATPIAFWASIPKRHIVVSLLSITILFAFYKSRTASSDSAALRTRCIAYAAVGFWAWVHAPEALAMFVVLVPLDIATARSNTWRRLSVVGGVFLTSLVPFFLTNWFISGDPLRPPRFLFGRGAVDGLSNTSTKEGSSRSVVGDGMSRNVAGGDSSINVAGYGVNAATDVESQLIVSEMIPPVIGQLSPILAPLKALVDLLLSGLDVIVSDPGRIFHTFVRSAPASTRATATDLALLETTPLFGVLIVLPTLLFLWWRAEDRRSTSASSPLRQTDVFALVFVLVFTLLYADRLPLNATWTVRYLLPLVPFGMYSVGRLEPVRRTVTDQARLLIYGYGSLVLVGGQLLVVLLVFLGPTRGEVVRIHGILGIVAGAIVGLWTIVTVLDITDDARIGAVVLAVSLAVGTLFVLLSGLEYFVVNHFGLATSELLSDAIPLF